jgi:hypothetical protein
MQEYILSPMLGRALGCVYDNTNQRSKLQDVNEM